MSEQRHAYGDDVCLYLVTGFPGMSIPGNDFEHGLPVLALSDFEFWWEQVWCPWLANYRDPFIFRPAQSIKQTILQMLNLQLIGKVSTIITTHDAQIAAWKAGPEGSPMTERQTSILRRLEWLTDAETITAFFRMLGFVLPRKMPRYPGRFPGRFRRREWGLGLTRERMLSAQKKALEIAHSPPAPHLPPFSMQPNGWCNL